MSALPGRADYQVDCTGVAACDSTDAGFKIYGGCIFNQNLGIDESPFGSSAAQLPFLVVRATTHTTRPTTTAVSRIGTKIPPYPPMPL